MRVQHEYRLLGPDGWHEHWWGPTRPANGAMVRHTHTDPARYHYHPELDGLIAESVLPNGHSAVYETDPDRPDFDAIRAAGV